MKKKGKGRLKTKLEDKNKREKELKNRIEKIVRKKNRGEDVKMIEKE